MKHSRLVWTGPNHPNQPADGEAQIFLTTRENPFPDFVVESIDFLSALHEPTPHFYAIAAEP